VSREHDCRFRNRIVVGISGVAKKDNIMVILSAISLIGFLCSLFINISATAKCAWAGSDFVEALVSILFITGLLLLLIAIIKAWDWSLAGFWDYFTDGMPGLAQMFMWMAIAYPMIVIGGQGRSGTVSRIMHPEFYTAIRDVWEFTSLLIPLFFLPMVYFWKERPQ